MFNVIGDIAGNFKTLQALLEKMPEGTPLSVGDMVDRGPSSKEVVEFFMENGEALLGNHEHMMLDHLKNGRFYSHGIWFYNGGGPTFRSFGENVPENVVEWMSNLPTYKELEIDGKKFFISHSFISPQRKLVEVLDFGKNSRDYDKCDASIIWSRDEPERRDEHGLQICGHNSQFGFRRFSDEEGEFAICLDSSAQRVLTGIHLPTMEIFQQEYIDEHIPVRRDMY